MHSKLQLSSRDHRRPEPEKFARWHVLYCTYIISHFSSPDETSNAHTDSLFRSPFPPRGRTKRTASDGYGGGWGESQGRGEGAVGGAPPAGNDNDDSEFETNGGFMILVTEEFLAV